MISTNKYNSRLDSFFAPDIYNLAMPVVPPADLTILSSATISSYLFFRSVGGSRIAGFDPADNPYIRGLGFTSNLADGLVDGSSLHAPGSPSWWLTYTPQVFGPEIGTITNTSGSTTVMLITGTGGSTFENSVAVGSVIVWQDNAGHTRTGKVLTIASGGMSLVLTAATASTGMYAALPIDTTAKVAYSLLSDLTGSVNLGGTPITVPFPILNYMEPYSFFAFDNISSVVPPTAKITQAAGSTTVTDANGSGVFGTGAYGVGLPIGWTDDLGNDRTGVIATIVDANTVTLNTATYSTGNNYTATTKKALRDLNGHLRIKVTMPETFFAYTITIDPAFGGGSPARRLSLSGLAEIEYTKEILLNIV